jgi:hypothetical protein
MRHTSRKHPVAVENAGEPCRPKLLLLENAIEFFERDAQGHVVDHHVVKAEHRHIHTDEEAAAGRGAKKIGYPRPARLEHLDDRFHVGTLR